MRTLLLIALLGSLLLTACGVRQAIPEEADRELLWFVGLSFSFLALSTGLRMLSGMERRWGRRADRWERRGPDAEPKS